MLDVERRGLARGAEPVKIEPKHFELLHLLVLAAPAAVSKQQIYDALWPDVVVEEANVHNLVSELRRLLGDSGRELIRTVHRFGYAFSGTLDTSSMWELLVGEQRFRLYLGINVIGRDGAADVVLDYPGISRRHAAIRVGPTDAIVEDLGSKNGTFVGTTRISGQTSVVQGDSLLFSHVAALLCVIRSDESTRTE